MGAITRRYGNSIGDVVWPLFKLGMVEQLTTLEKYGCNYLRMR